LTLGVSNTGYTASAEGTIAASRVFDAQKIPIAAGSTDLNYDWLWPYQSGPIIAVSKFLRIRTTFTSTRRRCCVTSGLTNSDDPPA
jgi:hypothetical protein